MSATTHIIRVPRLDADDDVFQVVATNGTKGLSLSIEQFVSGDKMSVTLTPTQAIDIARTLLAKAANVLEQQHDNDEGAR